MPLPEMTGIHLPGTASPYLATLDEIQQRFVKEAPHAPRRELIFQALTFATAGITHVFGPSAFLVGGEFISHQSSRPAQADLIFLPEYADDAAMHLETDPQALAWITLKEAFVWRPMTVGVTHLQSVGGLLDTRFVRPERRSIAHSLMSRERHGEKAVGHSEIGYVEVDL